MPCPSLKQTGKSFTCELRPFMFRSVFSCIRRDSGPGSAVTKWGIPCELSFHQSLVCVYVSETKTLTLFLVDNFNVTIGISFLDCLWQFIVGNEGFQNRKRRKFHGRISLDLR